MKKQKLENTSELEREIHERYLRQMTGFGWLARWAMFGGTVLFLTGYSVSSWATMAVGAMIAACALISGESTKAHLLIVCCTIAALFVSTWTMSILAVALVLCCAVSAYNDF